MLSQFVVVYLPKAEGHFTRGADVFSMLVMENLPHFGVARFMRRAKVLPSLVMQNGLRLLVAREEAGADVAALPEMVHAASLRVARVEGSAHVLALVEVEGLHGASVRRQVLRPAQPLLPRQAFVVLLSVAKARGDAALCQALVPVVLLPAHLHFARRARHACAPDDFLRQVAAHTLGLHREEHAARWAGPDLLRCQLVCARCAHEVPILALEDSPQWGVQADLASNDWRGAFHGGHAGARRGAARYGPTARFSRPVPARRMRDSSRPWVVPSALSYKYEPPPGAKIHFTKIIQHKNNLYGPVLIGNLRRRWEAHRYLEPSCGEKSSCTQACKCFCEARCKGSWAEELASALLCTSAVFFCMSSPLVDNTLGLAE
jgi:hypothetical protein